MIPLSRHAKAALPAGAPVVIGGGLAGLMVALCLAPRPVVVLTPAPLGTECSTAWAQGGIAASIGADDSAALHTDDTLRAGAGLCVPDRAAAIVQAGPWVVDTLARFGVRFDRDAHGAPLLGLEAAHARRRIVHAGGDGTGREIMRALVAAARARPEITILEGVTARRLITGDGIEGVLAAGAHDQPLWLPARQVVIATGGLAGLFLHGTNPAASIGSGLALAARAGAVIVDPEFVQFHPTALDTGRGDKQPMHLISEAVRGEGAVLIDEAGTRFMASVPGAELAPRDVVARAIWRQMTRDSSPNRRVFLDACGIMDFARRFPAINGFCARAGIDPAQTPIPVRPAAHYHMGGIDVDAEGRGSVPGLWACGEAASTGLHGANRLASNSLLEAAACASAVAASVMAADAGAPGRPFLAQAPSGDMPPAPDAAPVRPILSRAGGVLRDACSLRTAIAQLLPMAASDDPAADPALVGLMILVGAYRRTESRGAHHRTDHPATAAPRHTRLTLDILLADAAAIAGLSAPLARSA